MSAKKKFWLVGLVLAAIGILLVRVVSKQYDEPVLQLVLYAAGALLAFAGLGFIMYGIRKS